MINNELLQKAKQAGSAEELAALAEENGLGLNEEQARAYFDELHKTGELSDNELDNVAGGGCHKGDGRLVVTLHHKCGNWTCKYCGQVAPKPKSHVCPNHLYSLLPPNTAGICDNCEHMSYEKGLWLCNHPANKK